MKEALNEEALETLKSAVGDRIKPVEERAPGVSDHAASIMPVGTEEVQLLAEVAQRYSIPLVPLGAGMEAEVVEDAGSILVHFDLMSRTHLPDNEEPWIGAEPGATWLTLEDELRIRSRGLTVYPTSAPRATVGGALATDGLGVGSFEYGWLSENVLSAEVVLPGGELRTVQGEDLQSSTSPARDAAIVVNAKLKTRTARSDTPFAIAFDDPDALIGAAANIIEAGVPLWHLAFINPTMTRARGLEENYLLFGAYPGDRSEEVEEGLYRVAGEHGGRALPTAEVHRVWTERFFPVAPGHLVPNAGRAFVQLSQLPGILAGERIHEGTALQATLGRSKEVALLTFVPGA